MGYMYLHTALAGSDTSAYWASILNNLFTIQATLFQLVRNCVVFLMKGREAYSGIYEYFLIDPNTNSGTTTSTEIKSGDATSK